MATVIKGRVRVLSTHFRAVWGSFWAKNDRLDYPIGHYKSLIFRFYALSTY